MKNLAVLVGSLRKNSLNRVIYQHYQELNQERFSFQEISFAEYPLYNADLSEPQVVVDAAQNILKSDGVLFFTPEYNYSIPGVLKNAIDWLSKHKIQPFAGKPAAIIGASPGNIATARMQYHLRQVAVFLDLHIMNKPEMMVGQVMSKVSEGKLQD